jgi:hypothetical protein
MMLVPLRLFLSAWVWWAAAAGPAVSGSPVFQDWSTGATIRFDYYHSGDAASEKISVDGYRLEGPWPGSRTRLVEDLDLGKYRFEVRDGESGLLLYSRGFSSIFGEWETTGEARGGSWRTFHESQRFPEPRRSCRLSLLKRTPAGGFEPIFETDLEPRGRWVDRSPLTRQGEVVSLLEHGDPAVKVDLLILGDGYTAAERSKFRRDAERLSGALLETEPFLSRRRDFNVRLLHLDAQESGISDPRQGLWRNTPLGLSFNALDMDRYVLTYRNRELREAAALAPYDVIMILYNARKYGGGGIFNLWGTCSADTQVADYVFVHEFGHTFAGLADEYYTSQVSYEHMTPPGVEPWEPNLTALLDPASLKWKDLVTPGTPLPTPWDQAAYDRATAAYEARRAELVSRGQDAEVEHLFQEHKQATAELWSREPHAGKVGAFEGAGYEAHGLYRPALDCIMFSRNPTEFCPVCRRALERMIDHYTRP